MVESTRDEDTTGNWSPVVVASTDHESKKSTTFVTSTSIDSGNPSGSGVHQNDGTVSLQWEDPYILSLPNEEPSEPTTTTAATVEDTVSLASNILANFDKDASESV